MLLMMKGVMDTGSVAAPEVHVEGGLETADSVSDGVVVLGVGLVGTGGVGGGQFQVGLEDLDLAVVLGIDAGLTAFVVFYGEVFDSWQLARGAALLLEVLLNSREGEAEGHCQEGEEDNQQLTHAMI
jgi:drug/metabolite transporter (DMT)-like permease